MKMVIIILMLTLLCASCVLAQTEKKKYIVYLKDDPLFVYDKKVDKVVNKSLKFKVFGLFQDKSKLNKDMVKDYKINHIKDINDEKEDIVKGLKSSIVDKWDFIENGFTVYLDEDQLQELSKNPKVKSIHEDIPIVLDLKASVKKIGANSIHKESYDGLNITGYGVTVAVFDEGLDYTHDDLGNCTSDEVVAGTCKKVSYGYNFDNNTFDPYGEGSHGTHCAGIVGANGAIHGVAPNVTLQGYVTTLGSYVSTTILAVDNVTKRGDVDIITMSYGSSHYIKDFAGYGDTWKNLEDVGIIAVASAGNEGDISCVDGGFTVHSPAVEDYVISVANYYMDDDNIFFASSKGYSGNMSYDEIVSMGIDLAAPGRWINSTIKGESYQKLSGTSMAAPHVAGGFALLKQKYPNRDIKDLKFLMLNGAGEVSSRNQPYSIGNGLMNLTKSINLSFIVKKYEFNYGYDISCLDCIYNKSIIFNISSIKPHNVNINLSYLSDNGVWFEFNNTMPNVSNNYVTINSTIYVNNSLVDISSDGVYGYITFNSSDDYVDIPFWFIQSKSDVGCPTNNQVAYFSNKEFSANLSCAYPSIHPSNDETITLADNKVLDCNGSSFNGIFKAGTFIYAYTPNNIKIKNCHLTHYYDGLWLDGDGTGNEISEITLVDNVRGMVFESSGNIYNVTSNDSSSWSFYCNGCSNTVLHNFTYYDNDDEGAGIGIQGGTNVNVSNFYVLTKRMGLSFGINSEGVNFINGSIFIDDSDVNGIYVYSSSGNDLYDVSFYNTQFSDRSAFFDNQTRVYFYDTITFNLSYPDSKPLSNLNLPVSENITGEYVLYNTYSSDNNGLITKYIKYKSITNNGTILDGSTYYGDETLNTIYVTSEKACYVLDSEHFTDLENVSNIFLNYSYDPNCINTSIVSFTDDSVVNLYENGKVSFT